MTASTHHLEGLLQDLWAAVFSTSFTPASSHLPVSPLFSPHNRASTASSHDASARLHHIKLVSPSTSFDQLEPLVPEKGHPQFPNVSDPLQMKMQLQRPVLCYPVLEQPVRSARDGFALNAAVQAQAERKQVALQAGPDTSALPDVDQAGASARQGGGGHSSAGETSAGAAPLGAAAGTSGDANVAAGGSAASAAAG
ncbi:unnamed protein product [Amoebophrya sp. A120]|nr:unnamed protein product [Amoebophrya sp. A120]|eukprot:GSA120T00020863001.1